MIEREEFDHPQNCLTIAEFQWLLKRYGRHTKYYTYFLLRAYTGLRGGDMVNLRLYNFAPDLRWFSYKEEKRRRTSNRYGQFVTRKKHRTVVINDDWVRAELRAYLDRYCAVVEVDGAQRYISPFGEQKLFPMKNNQVVLQEWNRIRKKLAKAGFDAFRLETLTIHEDKGEKPTHILRPHIFRHFAATVHYYKHGKDIALTRKWIKHDQTRTTNTYLHDFEEIGAESAEWVERACWAEICGFEVGQTSMDMHVLAPSQTCLEMF